jgi:hypothetical protein
MNESSDHPQSFTKATKEYLGDGVYVRFDGFGYTVTTEDGISIQNTVYLEPDVYQELVNYVNRIRVSTAGPEGGTQ